MFGSAESEYPRLTNGEISVWRPLWQPDACVLLAGFSEFSCFPLIITEHFVPICCLSFRDYCGTFCFFDFVLLLEKLDVKD